MQLSTSSADLAIRLMHALHRYRADQLGAVAVSHFFVQALEDAVEGNREQRRKHAAFLFRIDMCLLDALDNLGQQPDPGASTAGQIDCAPAVRRLLHTLLPDVVRQVARIEVRQEANVLSGEHYLKVIPVPERLLLRLICVRCVERACRGTHNNGKGRKRAFRP